MEPTTSGMDVEQAVRERYSAGARSVEQALCCPVTYDGEYLAVIPREIIEKDYGCGDPTAYCRPGQVVLDLGSGAGKACYIMSQRVGPEGRVIGVDMNDDMLALARKYQREIAERIGYSNVEFRRGRIQNLRLDVDRLDRWLADHPVRTAADLATLEAQSADLSARVPLVEDESIDVVVSNCVLNLVRSEQKSELFSEMYRVLRNGGRAVISDIVSDETVPEALQRDPTLWSGCISGAFREDLFLKAFEAAGFHGIEVVKLDQEPWQTIDGIEFRSITVSAYKGKIGSCYEHNQAVIYKGPFSAVHDDDGHRYPRGIRVAVCDKTFRLLQREPYAGRFHTIEPRVPVPEERSEPFDCSRDTIRDPRETKGLDYRATQAGQSECCGTDTGCC